MAVVVAIVAMVGTIVHRSASASAPSFTDAHVPGLHHPRPQSGSSSAAPFAGTLPGRPGAATTGDGGDVTEEDGALPDGVTVFEAAYPGVGNLDPDLLQALQTAARDAAGDGVELDVASGWRSRAYQNELLRAAVARYGSEEEAARWVATADTSPHVSGDAVDIGTVEAAAWLSAHGAGYGLCQIYTNEPWHYELRRRATDRGCPRMYPDPRHDPRMQR